MAVKRRGVPSLLWLLLGMWLFWLARERWNAADPAGTAPRSAPEYDNAASRATPPREKHPVAQPPPAIADPSSEPAAPPGLTVALLEEIIAALRNEDRTAARRAAVRAGGVPGIATVRAALEAVPDPNFLVERGIMAHRGNEIIIMHRGQPRAVTPLSSINGEIQATIADADGSLRNVEFRVDQLGATERLRWFPPPENAAEFAARAILELASGNSAAVAASAPHCGALAPVFAHAALTGD